MPALRHHRDLSNGTGLASDYDVTLTNGTLTVNPTPSPTRSATTARPTAPRPTWPPTCLATIATGVNSETLDIAYSSTGDTATASAGSYDIDGIAVQRHRADDRLRRHAHPGTLTVMPAPLTITADNQTMIFGTPLPTLTASYSGFVNGETAASLTTLPTLSTTATADSPSSGNPYPITASGAVDPNYAISYVAGSLTVLTSTITLSPGSLDLGTTTAGTAGSVASFTVSGSNLTADLVISARAVSRCRRTGAPRGPPAWTLRNRIARSHRPRSRYGSPPRHRPGPSAAMSPTPALVP